MLALIVSQRKFYNYCEGQLGPQYLCQTKRSAAMWKKLGDEQKGHDILVVPTQFGLRHCGRSVRRACEVMRANEFGLGAFAVGIMLLTHPERLQCYKDLWIDCAGDEYSFNAAGQFASAPFFCFNDGRLRFYLRWRGNASAGFGSVSALIQQ